MSTHIGKVVLDGAPTIQGARVFALRLLQSRDPADTGRQFFACYDPAAHWLGDLVPALGTAIPGHRDPSDKLTTICAAV